MIQSENNLVNTDIKSDDLTTNKIKTIFKSNLEMIHWPIIYVEATFNRNKLFTQ